MSSIDVKLQFRRITKVISAQADVAKGTVPKMQDQINISDKRQIKSADLLSCVWCV